MFQPPEWRQSGWGDGFSAPVKWRSPDKASLAVLLPPLQLTERPIYPERRQVRPDCRQGKSQ